MASGSTGKDSALMVAGASIESPAKIARFSSLAASRECGLLFCIIGIRPARPTNPPRPYGRRLAIGTVPGVNCTRRRAPAAMPAAVNVRKWGGAVSLSLSRSLVEKRDDDSHSIIFCRCRPGFSHFSFFLVKLVLGSGIILYFLSLISHMMQTGAFFRASAESWPQ